MSEEVWNVAGQAMSEVNRQMLERAAGKSQGCSSKTDVLSDSDSYETADDDQRPLPDFIAGDVDSQRSAPLMPDDDDEQQQDSSELESSSEDDDTYADNRLEADISIQSGHRSEPEKRRKSYQFAVAERGNVTPDTNDDDEDDVVCDLDPAEFHHHHIQTSHRSSEGEHGSSHSQFEFCGLDPREFQHSSMQPKTLVDLSSVECGKCITSGTNAEDITSRCDKQNQSAGEVFEVDARQGTLEALGLLCRRQSEVCVTERHESIVEGNVTPTIVVHSPTEKLLVTDRREWIVHRPTNRAMFHYSHLLEHLPLFSAVWNVYKPTSQASESVLQLQRNSRADEQQVHARLSDTDKSLPVIEAVVSESVELICAKLIERADLWRQYDDRNLSSSPEKDSHYQLEEHVPPPDYDTSASSSDESSESEAGADDADDDDILSQTPPHRADRSPTPDYSTLSPVVEQDAEFCFADKLDDDGSDEVRVHNDMEEFAYSPSHLFARKGSQRFSKPVYSTNSSTVNLEPTLPEQADEDKSVDHEQKDVDSSKTFDLMQAVDSAQHGTDSCRAQEQYGTGITSAPVVVALSEKDMFQTLSKTHTLSVDQPTIYRTLGSTGDKKKRTSSR